MPMPYATCDAESGYPTETYPEPRRLRDAPAWCPLFLDEMFQQAVKHHRCNVQIACDLAGAHKWAVYRYRDSPQGYWFKVAWDLIVLDAQTLHSKHRR